ncbi:hypothetical protein CDL15_Pgr025400 [Punica granatum]|nr:hypothetical protein CDL15_Pgr025400 [Punica granatum]
MRLFYSKNELYGKQCDRATGSRYLGGVFDFESLVESTLQQQHDGIQTVPVTVHDVSNSSDLPFLLYGQQQYNGSEDHSLSHETNLQLGDPFQKHKMICRYCEKAPVFCVAVFITFLFFMVGLLLGAVFCGATFYVLKIGQATLRIEKLEVRAEAANSANG